MLRKLRNIIEKIEWIEVLSFLGCFAVMLLGIQQDKPVWIVLAFLLNFLVLTTRLKVNI
jgi:hypothetical protein